MKKIYITMCLSALVLTTSAQTTLDKPVVKPATSITAKSFTANWEPVKDAQGYCLFVYTQTPVTKDGTTTIISEDFGGITSGSIASPLGGEDLYVDLSDNGYSDTYGWSANAYPCFASGMVSGQVYSPYLDLRGDNGRYKVIISTYCNDGDTIQVISRGAGDAVVQKYATHVENGGTGYSTDTISFNNGSKDLFFSIINITSEPNINDWIDAVEVTQELKKGNIVTNLIAANEAIDAFDEDLNDSVKSYRFASMPYKGSASVVYYDLYASKEDWNTPNGTMPYTNIYSPFSNLVKVDLSAKTSEVIDPEATGIGEVKTEGQSVKNHNVYNLAGQKVGKDYKGIVIKDGKKYYLDKHSINN